MKVCGYCLLKVASRNWARHWRVTHKVHRKAQWIEHEWGGKITHAWFVSKPWKDNKRRTEEEYLKGIEIDYDMAYKTVPVLCEFLDTHKCKLPYMFRIFGSLVLEYYGEAIYKLPVLKDCYGIDWIYWIMKRVKEMGVKYNTAEKMDKLKRKVNKRIGKNRKKMEKKMMRQK